MHFQEKTRKVNCFVLQINYTFAPLKNTICNFFNQVQNLLTVRRGNRTEELINFVNYSRIWHCNINCGGTKELRTLWGVNCLILSIYIDWCYIYKKHFATMNEQKWKIREYCTFNCITGKMKSKKPFLKQL